jgi:hypothetical protein
VVLVTQSNACLSYLGRRLDLYGANTAEHTKCDELLCELMDLRNRMVAFAYPASTPPAAAPVDAAALLEAAAGRSSSFQKLENHLAAKVHLSPSVLYTCTCERACPYISSNPSPNPIRTS